MLDTRNLALLTIFLLGVSGHAVAQPGTTITNRLHHLRNGRFAEWSSFPRDAESESLELTFQSSANSVPWCLRLRQTDVKQAWKLMLNERQLGRLRVNENDMVVYYPIPAAALRDGTNQLRVDPLRSSSAAADDIRVGQIELLRQSRDDVLGACKLQVRVVRQGDAAPLPCRLTLIDASGSLQEVKLAVAGQVAVRPGVVYTANGQARIELPAGTYTLFAGRGFEYSRAERELRLSAGETVEVDLALAHEVPTPGYAACDTHVHSLTHSGHGDATVEERMVTLAGEGIELPIATDHNVHVDHAPFAEAAGVESYFTPVIGNEVTTRIGHFNVFPVRPGARTPDFRSTSYAEILAAIFATEGVKVAILNHARDLHSGVRPFGPARHNAVAGENLDGWLLGFNAMEVVNSSATQTKPLQLLHDWLGLLNSGRRITPVGSSDSHDVARHFVGQGRTYIRCNDSDPGNIDVDEAVNNFRQGRVLVSYGLLVELTVDEKYRSGELAAAAAEEVVVAARVLGPHWTSADRLLLFGNGQLLREAELGPADRQGEGIIAEREWRLARPRHDVHLVAVATGPGIDHPAWPTAKPYQPTSPDWQPQTLACSGPIWLDVDRDGRRTSARDYARRILAEVAEEPATIAAALAGYDAAVAIQAAFLVESRGTDLSAAPWRSALNAAPEATQLGFRQYLEASRASQRARAEGRDRE